MRPPNASDPDGADEWRYRGLAEVCPDLARRLVREYGEVWIPQAELPVERLDEVEDTLEIAVADEWEDPMPGSKRLRIRSWYTATTYWLPDWDGDDDKAASWIRDAAWQQAGSARFQRFRYGSTTWDEEGEARDEPLRPEEVRAWLKTDAEGHPYPG